MPLLIIINMEILSLIFLNLQIKEIPGLRLVIIYQNEVVSMPLKKIT